MRTLSKDIVEVLQPAAQPESARGATPCDSPSADQSCGTPFRIAHLSDPHLSRQYYREHLKSLKILLRAILEEGIDHVVISGDIVSTADPDDYFLAREVFNRAGLLDSRRLTLVPGNHDVFGGPHRAADVLSFPRHIRGVDYRRHLALFKEAFAETFEGVHYVVPGVDYPFVKKVGPFSLIGLNSIPPWSIRDNLLGTNGSLSGEQVEALERLGAGTTFNGSIPIVVIHHHFNNLTDNMPTNGLWRRIEASTMRMKRRRRLLRSFSSLGVRYVLHGHIHRNEVYELQGITLLNGAGAVCDDPVEFLKYNLVSVQSGQCSFTMRTLSIPYQKSTVNQALHRQGHRVGFPVVARS